MPLPHEEAPGLTAQEQGRSRFKNAFEIELNRIEPDPNQPRKSFEEEKHAELVRSIRELGLLQPIVVRWADDAKRYRIVAGERRFRAATEIGIPTIPCWIQNRDDTATQLASLAENWTRMELRPMELARALGRLRDGGLAQAEIARRTGKSPGEISKLLKLLTSHPDVQHLAETQPELLTKRHLSALADAPMEEQSSLAKRIIDGQLTVATAESMVAERRAAAGTSPRRRVTGLRRFTTSRGTVTFSCPMGRATDDEVLVALDEVRKQLSGR